VSVECPDCGYLCFADADMARGIVVQWHTDSYHDRVRRDLLRAMTAALKGRVAATAGHKVVIRFTASHAWFECACGDSGFPQDWSGAAIFHGRRHLERVGQQIINPKQWRDPLEQW
jgi:hypothetical protein